MLKSIPFSSLSVTLHLLLLLEMVKFGDNWTWPPGPRPPGSETMDYIEADVLHGVLWKLQVGLDEVFNSFF